MMLLDTHAAGAALIEARESGTLPDKPSDLLELALADLAKVEADPRYVVDMSQWHEYYGEDRKCHVCLAGSVLAGTLERKFYDTLDTDNYLDLDFDIKNKMVALDNLRMGRIGWALHVLRRSRKFIDEYVQVTPYECDPLKWRQDMEGIITMLRMRGL